MGSFNNREKTGFTPTPKKAPLFKAGMNPHTKNFGVGMKWDVKILPQESPVLKNGVWGFTLLELLVVVAIFSVITGASYALLNAGTSGSNTGYTKIELQEDSRRAMEAIVAEMSQSVFTVVDIGSAGESVTFQTPVEVDASGVWVDTDLDRQNDFYLENTLDGSGNVRWGAYLRGEDHTVASAEREGRQLRILLVGDELTRRVLDSNGTDVVEDFLLTDNIQSVTFSMISNEIIRISIEARKLTTDRHPIVYNLSTEAHLRSSRF